MHVFLFFFSVLCLGCQGGAVVSIRTSHCYDPGLIPAWGIYGVG